MTIRDLLADLRARRMPDASALAAFAAGLADGRVGDAQAGAFAMAVCTGPGLGEAGRVALTCAMAKSGRTLRWDLGAPVLDKHSTGGVGDPVSLLLAPALAALGAVVPMISGRGLGHTGGTLDKLEAIPGLSVELDEPRLRAVVGACGLAICAASRDIAPADRRLYAIRDVTATVDQIDLITASILAKKLAAGIGALVLDVKAGQGAFMTDPAQAQDLARSLVATARATGCPAAALITAMDEPLAPVCGNALEVAEVLALLRGGEDDGRLAEVTVELGAECLDLGGLASDRATGRRRMKEAIASGAAAERFARMVAAMGGPRDLLDRPDRHLPVAPVIRDFPAAADGAVTGIDGTALGRAVVGLGGGRMREGDRIDPAVGLDRIVRIGTRLTAGDPLCRIHAASDADADVAGARLRGAIVQGGRQVSRPLVLGRVA